ncbi:GlsB/YeaQ/YmgE family stress response membrane protein [Ahrensia sp. R2A130]|uniref:GlsB/YeaQ/YmgE family stress response membrane protein n=1 Tax=Ahrensia sp. R2A130 TaxID=744979 RepID=UPI0001E0B455|nr:GlsB/YeaQ/YmgE family stress response membrane protein [Ahrensia sp. R2A130]EFL90130.1 transglycosylase associated protein [Ahrensia sp. R2A130]
MTGLGWIMTIIIGGIAGFIAEKIMKADMGLLANIGLGILGAVVLNFLLSLLGVFAGGGIIVQGIVAVIGACLLIWVYRAIKSR